MKINGGRAYTFDVPIGAAVASTSRSGEPGFLFAIAPAFAGGIILNLMHFSKGSAGDLGSGAFRLSGGVVAAWIRVLKSAYTPQACLD